ncbi:MAG: adenylate kinase [Candidatus Omnitrophota bacterium]|nr:MAG: adenylate kinase [Candidatus Omnitrophota bacterium]
MKVILFGAPGSGKGTQAPLLSKHLNVATISLGDILREEVKRDSELGREVKGYMEKGALVPDGVVARVIEENVDKEGFILDGYPRNLAQAKNLEEVLQKKGQGIDAFIYFEVDEDTVINRLSKRIVCKKCGALYHLVNMPPAHEGVCDVCQGSLYQRKDDNPTVIKKRLEVFMQESRNVVDFYRDCGKLITVDARKEKDDVFAQIKEKLK